MVSKCICHDRTFKQILDYARDNGHTRIAELQDDHYCCCGCGLCIPYIELMFETGETGFEPGACCKRNKPRH